MPSATATPPPLSLDQVVQFHRDGFTTIPQLTTPQDLDRIRELLDALFARFDELPKTLAFDLGDRKLHAGPQRSPQINGAINFEPRLRQTLAFQNAGEIARQLMGPDAAYRFDHAIFKAPQNRAATPWHQDLAYGRQPDPIRWNVAFWIPLQDATVENGCMQFIPHSHLGNLRPHHPVGNDPQWHTLETDGVDAARAVACPVKAGGATLHLPKTLHYTGPNQTDQPRRAWILNFDCRFD